MHRLAFLGALLVSRFSAPAIKHIRQQGRTYSPAVPGGRPHDGPAILTQIISTNQPVVPFCEFAPTRSSCTGHPKPIAQGVPSATMCLAPATLMRCQVFGQPLTVFDEHYTYLQAMNPCCDKKHKTREIKLHRLLFQLGIMTPAAICRLTHCLD